jgi:hypothetical protein
LRVSSIPSGEAPKWRFSNRASVSRASARDAGAIARQCLNAGLLDEIWVDLVPGLRAGGRLIS